MVSNHSKFLFITIKIKSSYKHLLLCFDNIIKVLTNTNSIIVKKIPLKKQLKRWVFQRSPHVFKKSKQTIEYRQHINIYIFYLPKTKLFSFLFFLTQYRPIGTSFTVCK